MTEQEIFKKEAENGYTVCFAEHCPLKEQCLRYLVGRQMPDTRSFYHCVNPRYQDVGTERCSLFRSSKKVKFAKGMMHIFNADMPRRVEPFVRQRLPIIMSIATVHASSLLPSKRKCAVCSARLVGRRKYTSTAMLRIMSGKNKL